eukprot:superscaffoldBa00002464_g14330
MSVNASKHELIQLIHRHLKEHGFHSAADELQRHSPQVNTVHTHTYIYDWYTSEILSVEHESTSNQTQAEDDSSSDSEELSQSLLPQVKTPKKKGGVTSEQNTPAAATAGRAPSVAKPATPKKKKEPAKKAETPKKKSVPAKRKKSEENAVKAKKSKTKDKVAAAGGDSSDSDSSLDVEKWKRLLLQMTDADIAKMDTINALDSSSPTKKRVRKPRAKAPAKTDTLVKQNNETVEKNGEVEEKAAKETPKTDKLKKSWPKKTAPVDSSATPSQEQNLNTAEERAAMSTLSPSKKEKRKVVTPTLRQARRDRQLVSKRLLLNEDEEQQEVTMDTDPGEQDVVSLFHKLQHCGPEKEAHLKALSKSLRDPSAQLTFIKQENSMHLLVGLLTGTNAQCRLQAVRCLHELSHSPHPNVTPACLPATPYLLTYLSGQSTKFTELCLYTLGNLCPDSDVVKEKLLAQGIIPALATCIENQRHNLAVVEAVGFTLSQLLQAKDAAEKIIPMVLASSLPSHLLSVLTPDPKFSLGPAIECAWCLHYLTCRCVGNLLSSCPVEDLSAQVRDGRLVVALCALLQAYFKTRPALARESAWVLNNLTAHSGAFCSALLILNLVPGLIQLLPFSQGINTMILRVLANIAYKKKEFCVQLAQLGLLSALCATLKMADQEMVTLSLDVLFMLVVSSTQPNTLYSFLAVEDTESTTSKRKKGMDANQEADHGVLMSSKPLHRFVQREPRSLGIVILICGCAELLMGFQLASESVQTSCEIYIPFWQGFLVTVCLSMYVVSLLGIVVSIVYRIYCFAHFGFLRYRGSQFLEHEWTHNRIEQLFGIEGILFTSSLCVSVLLIFLCVIARLALKSTNTQMN